MTSQQEEMAVAWAKKIGTPYLEDPVFQVNFLSDFLKLFPPKYNGAKISDIIFPTLPEKVELTKEQKKALATERKKKRLELKEKFGYTIVDGVKTEITNWVVEPPGLFMGRGQHSQPRPLEAQYSRREHYSQSRQACSHPAGKVEGDSRATKYVDCVLDQQTF